jgi:hypothetical protein
LEALQTRGADGVPSVAAELAACPGWDPERHRRGRYHRLR